MRKRFTDPLGWFILILTFIAAFLFAILNTQANWEEIPAHGTTVDIGGLANEKATSYTAQALHATSFGWAGLQANEIRAGGEVESQNIDARIQGDFGWLQIYVEGNKSMDDLAVSGGFYLRKTFELDRLGLTFGAGTLVEREDVRTELGLEDTDPTTSPYLLGIAAARYDLNDTVSFNAKVIGTPEYAFERVKGTALLGIDVRVADNALLKVQSVSEFDYENNDLTFSTENTILLSLNYD